jgi:ABC-type oligopeptide transport system substrate-binding subunit
METGSSVPSSVSTPSWCLYIDSEGGCIVKEYHHIKTFDDADDTPYSYYTFVARSLAEASSAPASSSASYLDDFVARSSPIFDIVTPAPGT